MIRRRLIVPALAVAAGLLVGSVPTAAHDHRPPRAELRFGSLFQEGRLARYHWSSITADGGCLSSLIVASTTYPRPGLPVGVGRFRAALRLFHPDRPLDLAVVARHRGPDVLRPAPLQDVAYSIRPRRAGGEVIGWAAILRSRVEEHLYLRVTGTWHDRQGCLGRQRATWLFHVSGT